MNRNRKDELVCYLIEYPHGTSELWLRPHQLSQAATYQPLALNTISGQVPESISHTTIARAISLDAWMRDHAEVIREGKTSFDGGTYRTA